MSIFALLVFTLSFLVIDSSQANSKKIDSRLLLSRQQSNNIIVTFTQGTDQVIQAIQNTRFRNREERLKSLNQHLESHSRSTQKGVKQLIHGRYKYESHWISNQLHVEDASDQLIIALASREDVQYVAQEEVYQRPHENQHVQEVGEPDSWNDGWGVRVIKAREAAKLLEGRDTHNVTVAIIGGGVRSTHESLKDNWLGLPYGWFDPIGQTQTPMPSAGIDTYSMGILCGKGFGVYPQAKWMSCKACADWGCHESALLRCMEYLICPNDGKVKDCSKAPQVVLNVWGGSRTSGYANALRAMNAARIVSFFTTGSGGTCGSIASPGDSSDAIAVTTINQKGELVGYSGIGPSADGRIKPDLTAPGVDIVSASDSSDDGYIFINSRSGAPSHAAGVAAMLYALKHDLTSRNVFSLLAAGAVTSYLKPSNGTCGGIIDSTFPNNHFGYGLVNAENSVNILLSEEGGSI